MFKKALICILLLFAVCSQIRADSVAEENEFAEFEDDDIFSTTEQPEEVVVVEQTSTKAAKPKAVQESDEFNDDFGVVDDDDVGDEMLVKEEKKEAGDEPNPQHPLKFADVPAHFRSNWASYQVEALVLMVILVYMGNYLMGRNTNQTVATQCFENCRPFLSTQFSLVGDDGTSETPEGDHLRRETDCSFALWCSGRAGVSSLLLNMKMVKRQDLVSRVMAITNPQVDRLTLKVVIETGDVDPAVLVFGEKRAVAKQAKDMLDLSSFTTERKGAASQFNLPASFALFSEQNESTYAILDPAVATVLRKYEDAIEFVHVSDQFSGPKPPEGETFARLPETAYLLLASLNIANCNDEDSMTELLSLVFYLVEKIRKMRLSKEAKVKADKKRKEFEENFLRTTHQYRQEAAQARREEKTRERKQRLLEEEDPDKQRRLEQKELKREAKSKQPKMKQLKAR